MIVDTGLEILRVDGLEAVTMRRVAYLLDTGPASLYVYIRNREELRLAMLDRVTESIELESPDPGRWREQVHLLVRQLLDALEDHPGIALVAATRPPSSERRPRIADALLGLLNAGGIDAQDAAWACDVLPMITTASVIAGSGDDLCEFAVDTFIAGLVARAD
ncbi:MAG: TetR/AcrR family transcriptional regulator [Solirubrobacteraceae bacterium]